MRTICKLLKKVARPEGLEPPTLCFEGRCSIQLSYGRTVQSILPSSTCSYLENVSFKSRCNRCNSGLFGWICGKIETKSNGTHGKRRKGKPLRALTPWTTRRLRRVPY